MEAERWHRADALLAAALELPPERRSAFLDEACSGDPRLRRTVEELLAADAAGTSFLDHPFARLPAPAEAQSWAGRRLGPYTLTGVLGRGGMGVVYLARRDDGEYESRVAVKVLRRSLAGEEARRRFLAERQILARLQHPHIARLYDGGTTPEGLPYLVLEHVEGLPLDRYCDQHGLGLDARLDLFGRICAAVQHAHRHLLVHRDLKPGNILVTPQREPKLLDFGIAKQLAPEEGGAPETRTGLRVMTPRYASPEQIRGEPVTTASDVYALGILLYELLAGCSPYRVAEGAPLHELERAVCEVEPERPSTALERDVRDGGAGRAHRTRTRELRRLLRGDLDNVVLKALRKDPARRYASAAQLAEDLERWRRRLPVTARRDSFLYRAGLFVRRHRWAMTAAAAGLTVLLGLLGGLVAERERTLRERNKARHALSFLVEVFRGADPFETGGERLTARHVLEHGAARVSRELQAEPEVQASIMDAIGQAYLGLGMLDRAEPLLTGALARRRAAASPELASSLESLADLRAEQGDYPAAARFYEQALALRRRQEDVGTEIARTLNRLADVRIHLQRLDDAEALFREALGLYRAVEGPEGQGGAETLLRLALLARERGRYEEAERLFAAGIGQQRRNLGSRHPTVGGSLSALALVRLDRGALAEAEELLREALAIHEESLEEGHPQTLETLNNLAITLYMRGNLAGAEAAGRRALALYRRRLDPGHPLIATALANLGSYVLAQKRAEEAGAMQEEALAIRLRVFGERHLKVAESLTMLTRIRFAQGRLAEAEGLARRAAGLLGELLGEDHPNRAYPLTDLGRILLAQGRFEEAEVFLRQSLEVREGSLPASHFEISRSRADLGECLTRQGRYGEAEPLLLGAEAALAAQFPDRDKRVLDTRRRLVELYRAWGCPAAAARYGRESPPGSDRHP